MIKDHRPKGDRHALTSDGVVLCNPRDKEAAHRAQIGDSHRQTRAAVTCRKCRERLCHGCRGRRNTQ